MSRRKVVKIAQPKPAVVAMLGKPVKVSGRLGRGAQPSEIDNRGVNVRRKQRKADESGQENADRSRH
jgi:hypothetical protein